MRFKRNQVEEAIARQIERNAGEPSTELRTKLKRLLETDRKLGRSPRSTNPERARYAFYSGEAPGSGIEVWFSMFEAFALFVALVLLEHGWPQTLAVSIMRRARSALEPKHGEILKRDPHKTFDEEAIMRTASPGSLGVPATDSVFLAIASRGKSSGQRIQAADDVRVLDEKELMRFCRSEVGLSVTSFELVRAAFEFMNALIATRPSRRGPTTR